MKNKTKNLDLNFPEPSNQQLDNFPGYPQYPESEDIYNKFDKEFDIDPENIYKNKEILKIDKTEKPNELDFNHDKSGSDLDIPGSELDDDLENIGSEDEENNGYSIGSDNHNDLEEDKS